MSLVHSKSVVSVGTSWALVVIDVFGSVVWTVVTSWAWVLLVVINTLPVTVVSLWTIVTLVRVFSSLDVVVGSLIAWDWSKVLLWAEVTLWTDPHDTVVLNAVVACLARDTREL